MPIVTCSCGAKLKTSDKMRGKTVKCPKCGELVELIQNFNETVMSNDEPSKDSPASLNAKAYDAQYNKKNERDASLLYQALIVKFPDSQEAKFARRQLSSIQDPLYNQKVKDSQSQLDNIPENSEIPTDSNKSAIASSTTGGPSGLAQILSIVGYLSIIGGFIWLIIPDIETYQSIILFMSSVISGIFMFGFGSMVDNLNKIEHHLRTR